MTIHRWIRALRIMVLTVTIGSALGAAVVLGLRFGDHSTRLTLENATLKDQMRDLVVRLADLETSVQEVDELARSEEDATLDTLTAVLGQTGLDPLKDGRLYLATKPVERSPAAVAAMSHPVHPGDSNAEVVARMAQAKLKSTLLASQLEDSAKAQAMRREILAAIPSRPPMKGWVSSKFGVRDSPFHPRESFHKGIDLAGDLGSKIYAPADGVVAYANKYGGYGLYIRIEHGFGISTRYAHNAELVVKKGQKVRRGDQIAVMGDTGRTTGPHLHYEILVHDQQMDPSRFFIEEQPDDSAPPLLSSAETNGVVPMGGEDESDDEKALALEEADHGLGGDRVELGLAVAGKMPSPPLLPVAGRASPREMVWFAALVLLLGVTWTLAWPSAESRARAGWRD